MYYPIAERFNVALFVSLSLLNIFFLFGLPLLIHDGGWQWIWVGLISIIFTNTYWSLIHEGIHRMFHSNTLINEACSRIMAILFGCSFNIVRTGHLLHHKLNRSAHDRYEVYEKEKHNWIVKTIYYYWFLINGLYFVELILPVLSFLPRKYLLKIVNNLNENSLSHEAKIYLTKFLLNPKALQKIRIDTSFIYVIFAISFMLYGVYWWLLIIFLCLRGLLISMADNLPHYGTPLDETRYAFNLKAPSWLSFLLLNFNYHRVHHVAPNIPWIHLPRAFKATDAKMDISYQRQWLQQLKGLLPVENLVKSKDGGS